MSQATKVIIIFPAHLSDNRWLDSTNFDVFLHKGATSAVFPKKSWPFPVGCMNGFLAVSENFPAAELVDGYKGPFLALFSVTRHQGCGCGCLRIHSA
ncbi:hypothetical protein MJK71_29035 [Escherichia coli]|nr:hypothetical protein MJK71_29035 [Escherichia coli]